MAAIMSGFYYDFYPKITKIVSWRSSRAARKTRNLDRKNTPKTTENRRRTPENRQKNPRPASRGESRVFRDRQLLRLRFLLRLLGRLLICLLRLLGFLLLGLGHLVVGRSAGVGLRLSHGHPHQHRHCEHYCEQLLHFLNSP